MKALADSLTLASANTTALGLAYLGGMTGMPHFTFGSILNDLAMLASPVLLLATLVYLPRDLVRRYSRLQALAALGLSAAAVPLLGLWVHEIVLL